MNQIEDTADSSEFEGGIDPFDQAFNAVRRSHQSEFESNDEQESYEDSDANSDESEADDQETESDTELETAKQQEISAAIEKLKEFEEYKQDLIRLKGFDPEAANQRTEKIFGKLGQLEQLIKDSVSSPVKDLSIESFAELNEDYPDIAEHLINGLNRVLTERRVIEQAPIDTTAFDAAVSARLALQEHEFKRMLIQVQHPDYNEILTSEDFENWKNAQDETFKQEASRTQDISFAIKAITSFKEFQQAKSQKTQQKQNRLQAAVGPKTSSPSSQRTRTQEDPFDAELKRTLRHRR